MPYICHIRAHVLLPAPRRQLRASGTRETAGAKGQVGCCAQFTATSVEMSAGKSARQPFRILLRPCQEREQAQGRLPGRRRQLQEKTGQNGKIN